ncbi:hypothetical protein SJY04_18380 [Aeromonas dhakensis]|uniref:hypothetical protein n=1 Tax=Aeromonas dhakensis TaxID=196024 RepID=UPI00191DACAD|nr:hypothetical protein [Aeromonas dhakensis]MBL0675602.1 hypothetical protein [Aeromonas dhakensis]MDX7743093.1 hypothetical protein [Aeromonas dhakensis]
MKKAAFAVTDEGDEGVVSVIGTTKVTRSTLADQPLLQPRNGAVQRRLEQGSAAINLISGGTISGRKAIPRAKKRGCEARKSRLWQRQIAWFLYLDSSPSSSKTEQNRPFID